MSDVQNYIEYIKKTTQNTNNNLPIHIYINKINNRLLYKKKDGYKLELQKSETMKLFCSTKKLIDNIKNGENVPSLEMMGVVLVQCNLVDNQNQQKFEVLYTFTPKFFKTYSTEFDEINIKFTDQNG